MFKRILVPLDGSERAEQAIPVAVGIARANSGSVILLRATTEPADLYWLSVEASEGAQDVLEVKRDEIKQYLAQLASSEALEGVETVTKIVDGAAAEAILSVASAQDVDLIVMCSHGYTGIKRWVLGSVAHKVAWHSTTPVLVLRESSQKLNSLSPNVGHPIRALVALDSTPFTEAALMPAAQLVTACSAPARGELHLAHVIKLPSLEEERTYERLGIDTRLRRAALQRADQYMHNVKERLSHEMGTELAVDVAYSIEESTDVAETLLKMAQGEGEVTRIPCDLIAMTTHGRNGLTRWMRGSVAERVLSSTTMPLLIVHPHKQPPSFAPSTSESEQVNTL